MKPFDEVGERPDIKLKLEQEVITNPTEEDKKKYTATLEADFF